MLVSMAKFKYNDATEFEYRRQNKLLDAAQLVNQMISPHKSQYQMLTYYHFCAYGNTKLDCANLPTDLSQSPCIPPSPFCTTFQAIYTPGCQIPILLPIPGNFYPNNEIIGDFIMSGFDKDLDYYQSCLDF